MTHAGNAVADAVSALGAEFENGLSVVRAAKDAQAQTVRASDARIARRLRCLAGALLQEPRIAPCQAGRIGEKIVNPRRALSSRIAKALVRPVSADMSGLVLRPYKPACETSCSEMSQRRRAASLSRAVRDGVFSLHLTKYLPETPAISGETARCTEV